MYTHAEITHKNKNINYNSNIYQRNSKNNYHTNLLRKLKNDIYYIKQNILLIIDKLNMPKRHADNTSDSELHDSTCSEMDQKKKKKFSFVHGSVRSDTQTSFDSAIVDDTCVANSFTSGEKPEKKKKRKRRTKAEMQAFRTNHLLELRQNVQINDSHELNKSINNNDIINENLNFNSNLDKKKNLNSKNNKVNKENEKNRSDTDVQNIKASKLIRDEQIKNIIDSTPSSDLSQQSIDKVIEKKPYKFVDDQMIKGSSSAGNNNSKRRNTSARKEIYESVLTNNKENKQTTGTSTSKFGSVRNSDKIKTPSSSNQVLNNNNNCNNNMANSLEQTVDFLRQQQMTQLTLLNQQSSQRMEGQSHNVPSLTISTQPQQTVPTATATQQEQQLQFQQSYAQQQQQRHQQHQQPLQLQQPPQLLQPQQHQQQQQMHQRQQPQYQNNPQIMITTPSASTSQPTGATIQQQNVGNVGSNTGNSFFNTNARNYLQNTFNAVANFNNTNVQTNQISTPSPSIFNRIKLNEEQIRYIDNILSEYGQFKTIFNSNLFMNCSNDAIYDREKVLSELLRCKGIPQSQIKAVYFTHSEDIHAAVIISCDRLTYNTIGNNSWLETPFAGNAFTMIQPPAKFYACINKVPKRYELTPNDNQFLTDKYGVVNIKRKRYNDNASWASDVRLEFNDVENLYNAVLNGIWLGRNRYKVTGWVFGPRACYKCLNSNHYTDECELGENEFLCFKCSGAHHTRDHVKSTNNSQAVRCIICGTDHPAFSDTCLKLANMIVTSNALHIKIFLYLRLISSQYEYIKTRSNNFRTEDIYLESFQLSFRDIGTKETIKQYAMIIGGSVKQELLAYIDEKILDIRNEYKFNKESQQHEINELKRNQERLHYEYENQFRMIDNKADVRHTEVIGYLRNNQLERSRSTNTLSTYASNPDLNAANRNCSSQNNQTHSRSLSGSQNQVSASYYSSNVPYNIMQPPPVPRAIECSLSDMERTSTPPEPMGLNHLQTPSNTYVNQNANGAFNNNVLNNQLNTNLNVMTRSQSINEMGRYTYDHNIIQRDLLNYSHDQINNTTTDDDYFFNGYQYNQ
jgi:hypothetical protein